MKKISAIAIAFLLIHKYANAQTVIIEKNRIDDTTSGKLYTGFNMMPMLGQVLPFNQITNNPQNPWTVTRRRFISPVRCFRTDFFLNSNLTPETDLFLGVAFGTDIRRKSNKKWSYYTGGSVGIGTFDLSDFSSGFGFTDVFFGLTYEYRVGVEYKINKFLSLTTEAKGQFFLAPDTDNVVSVNFFPPVNIFLHFDVSKRQKPVKEKY